MGKHSKPPVSGAEFDAQYAASQAAGRPETPLQGKVDAYTAARREDAANARQTAAKEPSTGTESNTVIGRFLGRKK